MWRGTQASSQEPKSACQSWEDTILEADPPVPIKPSDNHSQN